MNYYEWKRSTQRCGECAWTGTGSECAMGESFSDGAEYECPKCGYCFGYKAYPLLRETLAEPSAPRVDKLFAALASGATLKK